MSRLFTAIEVVSHHHHQKSEFKSPMRMQAGAHSPFRKQSDRSTSGVGGVCCHFKRTVIGDDGFVMSRSCVCVSVGTTLALLI